MRIFPVFAWIGATYVLLLIMSWSLVYFTDTPNLLHKHQKVIEADHDQDFPILEDSAETKKISFYHLEADTDTAKPVILLHDYFYPAPSLLDLAHELNESGFEVIIPDRPGYGQTTFSQKKDFGSAAKSISSLLDYLDIQEYHLVAHADGGPLAFYLTKERQYEPHSLVLLSASGVEELKLLGNHTLNRSLLTLQFPVYWFIDYLVPHFGWVYQTPYQYHALQTTYESDFRPVRNLIREFENPAKVIHGKQDNYIPVQNAEELHRLLPQSELILMNSDHLLFQVERRAIAELITKFLLESEAGESLTRSEAPEDRRELSEEAFGDVHTASLTGLALVLMLTLLAMTTLVSEDIACIGAGLLVAKGVLGFFPALAACIAGILVADITIYWLGRWIGSPMLRWVPFRWFIEEEDVRDAERLFKESGLAIIFVSRFLPGTRFPTYFSAGMIRARFSLFLLYFMISILVWAPILVGLSMLIGQTLIDYLDVYQEYAIWILLGLILFIFLIIKYMMPLITESGRRTVNARIERVKRKFLRN